MSTTTATELNPGERELLLGVLREAVPELSGRGPGGPVDRNLDALVRIVRRSSASRIEPYLAQILEDVCAKCPCQQFSGFCPLRYEKRCVLYRNAGPIIAAIRRGLHEIDVNREFEKVRKSRCDADCPRCKTCGA